MSIRNLFLTALLFCISPVFSQDILWEKSLGGKHAEYLFDAIPTPDYGFILAGSSISGKNGSKQDSNKGNFDYWIWKLDEDGTLNWQKSFGGDENDMLNTVRLTKDGGFILAGTSASNKGQDKKDNSKGQDDFWIIKLDAKGSEIWQRTIGGMAQEKLFSILQTKDGGYILGGTSASDKTRADEKGVIDPYGKNENSRGNLDYWVEKLDSDGKIEWQKTLGGKYNDELRSIIQTDDKGYVLGGYSNSPVSGDKTESCFGGNDYWVVKLDEKGETQWQKTYGGDKDDILTSLILTKDNNIVLGGYSASGATNNKSTSSANGTDIWLLKADLKGDILWQENHNYGKHDMLSSIIENQDGTLLIGAYAQSEATSQKKSGLQLGKGKPAADKEGVNDYIALKTDAQGKELWSEVVGSKGDEVLKKLLETRDGGYILAGTSNGQFSRNKKTNSNGYDFWIVKLRDKDKPKKPKAPIEAIPNPAETFTNVIVGFEFDNGTATVYDLAGRQLQQFEIHEKTIPVDLSKYPEGVYIVEVRTNTHDNSVKVIKRK
ncbi:T9SS type A sorting domain-containing protein [Flavobacterium pedocola]